VQRLFIGAYRLVGKTDAEQGCLRLANTLRFAVTCFVRIIRIQRQVRRREEVANLLEQREKIVHGDSRLVGGAGFSLRKKYRVFPRRKLVQCSNFLMWSFAAWCLGRYCIAPRPQHKASRLVPFSCRTDAWIQRRATMSAAPFAGRRLVALRASSRRSGSARTAAQAGIGESAPRTGARPACED